MATTVCPGCGTHLGSLPFERCPRCGRQLAAPGATGGNVSVHVDDGISSHDTNEIAILVDEALAELDAMPPEAAAGVARAVVHRQASASVDALVAEAPRDRSVGAGMAETVAAGDACAAEVLRPSGSAVARLWAALPRPAQLIVEGAVMAAGEDAYRVLRDTLKSLPAMIAAGQLSISPPANGADLAPCHAPAVVMQNEPAPAPPLSPEIGRGPSRAKVIAEVKREPGPTPPTPRLVTPEDGEN